MQLLGRAGASIGRDGRLVVFAHEDEAQAFERVPHFVTGIGKLNAAVSLAKILADEPVREVVVLGTAGLIDDSLDLASVYRVSAALQHDLGFDPPTAELLADGRVVMQGVPAGLRRLGAGASAGAAAGAGGADAGAGFVADAGARAPEFLALPDAVIATGDQFVTDDDVRLELAARGAGLVDMESYAFATLAAQFGVPMHIFKVPSDFADSDTTDETWDDVVLRKSHELFDFAKGHDLI